MSDIIKLILSVETKDSGDYIETEAAVLVTNLNGDKVWLPKSQIEIIGDQIELPEWLAETKELI